MAWGKRRRRSTKYNAPGSSKPATPYTPSATTPRDTTKDVYNYFPSWDSFTDHVVNIKGNSTRTSSQDTSSYRDDFSGTRSFPEAVELSRKGYTKIVPDIMKSITSIEHLLHKNEMEETLYMDVFSPIGVYDMGAVCAGIPENAVNITERESDDKNGNTVVVNFDTTISGSYSTEELTKRGACVASLVYALELSGYSVQVNAIIEVMDVSRLLTNVIKVKDYTSPLDLPMLAFQLAHPSMLRRLGFKALEIQGVEMSGYGFPLDQSRFPGMGFIATMAKDEVFIPADFPSDRYETNESACAFIQEKIKEISERYK